MKQKLLFLASILAVGCLAGCATDIRSTNTPQVVTDDPRIMDAQVSINAKEVSFTELLKTLQVQWNEAVYPLIPPVIVIEGALSSSDKGDSVRFTIAATNISASKCLKVLSILSSSRLSMRGACVVFVVNEGCVSGRDSSIIEDVPVSGNAQTVLGLGPTTTPDILKNHLLTLGIQFSNKDFWAAWWPNEKVIHIYNDADQVKRVAGLVSLMDAGYKIQKPAHRDREPHR